MKLPDDKNERNKILGLIAIGVLAVCYIGYTFGIKVLLQKQQAALAEIAELEAKVWQANLDIKQIPLYIQQNDEIVENIINISENKLDILHSNLGNFLLVAEDIIERNAQSLDLTVKSVNPTGSPVKRFDTPVKRSGTKDSKKDAKAPRFAPYTVSVEMECGLVDAMNLIRSIEKKNPYLCITRLGIIGQPDNVTQHSITFDVQWPIWIDAKQPMKLVSELVISKSKQ